MLTAPALWTETDGTVWIFTTTWTGVTGFNILIDALGHPILVPRWTVTGFYSSPLMVRDVLFVASNDAIKALNPITGALLWSDSLATIHWQVPMVRISSGCNSLLALLLGREWHALCSRQS